MALDMFFTSIVSILGILLLSSVKITSGNKEYTEFVNSIFENYDKGIRPNSGGEPVIIGVTTYILGLTDVDDKDMTFTVSMYFRQLWNDPRLRFNVTQSDKFLLDRDLTIQLQGDQIMNLWEPDTFIVNEVNSFQHQAFVLNELARIDSSGNVLKSSRYTITATCPMNLQYYPFDENICTFEIESFGYTMRSIQYKWDKGENSVGISTWGAMTPTHKINGHMQKKIEVALSSGNYSRLVLEFIITRSVGRFILRFFIPMILFTCVSLASLWVTNEKMAPLVNFLNICFINLFIVGGSSEMPTISYATNLDTYFTICLLHITICLIDSIVANYFVMPVHPNQPIEMTPRRQLSVSDDVENLVTPSHGMLGDTRRNMIRLFEILNFFVKIGLLSSFALCSLIFFIVCANAPRISFEDYIPLTY